MSRHNPESLFWPSRGYLAHIRHVANCKGQSPWPMLGWAIVRALHTVPYTVLYESQITDSPLNSLVGISGPTGAGKTISANLVEKFLIFPDNDPRKVFSKTWTGRIPPGSGESMPDSYVSFLQSASDDEDPEDAMFGYSKDRLSDKHVWRHPNHAAVFFFDEVGMLESRSNRQGSTLVEFMTEAWSGSEFGRALANGKGLVLPQNSYRFACVFNTQPKRAGVLFSKDAIASGFQGRFLWFDVTADVNRDLVTDEHVAPIYIPYIDWTGVEKIKALEIMNQAHLQHKWNAHDGLITESESHILLTQARVAVALAVLEGRVELSDEDWHLAEVVIQQSKTTREAIEEVLEEEYRRAIVRDGRSGAVKAAMSEEARHKVHVEGTAAAILRRRGRQEKKRVSRSALSQNQRAYLEEAEDFLEMNPDWRPPRKGNG